MDPQSSSGVSIQIQNAHPVDGMKTSGIPMTLETPRLTGAERREWTGMGLAGMTLNSDQ